MPSQHHLTDTSSVIQPDLTPQQAAEPSLGEDSKLEDLGAIGGLGPAITFGDNSAIKAAMGNLDDANAYEIARMSHLEQLAFIKLNGQLNNLSYNSVIDQCNEAE